MAILSWLLNLGFGGSASAGLPDETVSDGVHVGWSANGKNYIAQTRWNAVIVNPTGPNDGITCGGTSKLTRLQVRNVSRFGVYVPAGVTLEMEDCWVHNCQYAGIYVESGGTLKMRRCLTEVNGHHPAWNYDLYAAGSIDIQNCIFRNPGTALTVKLASGSTGVFSYNQVEGPYGCLDALGSQTIQHNTLVGAVTGTAGQLTAINDPANLNYLMGWPAFVEPPTDAAFVAPSRSLWWLKNPAETKGCYAYNASLTLAYAVARWTNPPNGMGIPAAYQITPFLAFYPGDTP